MPTLGDHRDVFRAEGIGEIEASGERVVYAAAVEAMSCSAPSGGKHAAHEPGKAVETVVEVMTRARLADGVAGLRPIGVIKG